MVKVENVSKSYKDVLALDNVSMQIDKGKIVCLVGPNGSGKSTLIKIILGLSRASKGKVSFEDANPTVGYLTELNALPNGYKGTDILRKLETLIGVDRSQSVVDLKQLFGIDEFISKKIKGYSKGMQKKIGLLIAFSGDPDLVILDEPFEGIDTIDRDKLSGFLKSYVANGKTVILSTHILYELDSLCNHAHFLKKGRLVSSLEIQIEKPESASKLRFNHIPAEYNVNDFGSSPTIADIYRRIYQ